MNTQYGNKGVSFCVFVLLFVMSAAALASPPYGRMGYGMSDEEMQEMMGGYRGWGVGAMGGCGRGMPMGSMMMGSMMMGPMGYGPMMGYGRLDLSSEQRAKLRGKQRDMRKQHLALMDEMMEKQDGLAELYAKTPRDAEKIGKIYGELFELKRKMIEQQIRLGNDIDALLTKEQKEKAGSDMPMSRHRGMMQWWD
jgi:Spy/CpxP family protein refolding chaperone